MSQDLSHFSLKLSCGRWGGAASKAAEVNAQPSVATADKAVHDATKSKQPAPDASRPTTNRTSAAAAASHQPSNKDADGLLSIQERRRGQNQETSLP